MKIIMIFAGLIVFSSVVAEEVEMEPFINVKDAVEFVRSYKGEAKDLKLLISDELNDSMGMNMAIIGDSILAKGFVPNGFDQKSGYRIYIYKTQ